MNQARTTVKIASILSPLTKHFNLNLGTAMADLLFDWFIFNKQENLL